ncbi:MAG: DUF3313 domain-containing protein [Proteobacteria bacterium]|nr:DUF3313 domain-containing protein [Pseudomonadota bacterium]
MKSLLLILFSLLVVACTSAPPALQTGPDAEYTFDGLVRVDNSRFRNAWADPEVDFSQYNKVMAGGAEFEFRAVSKTAGRTSVTRARQSEFWISDANRDKLVDTVSEVFKEELSKAQGWELAEEAGPDVLILRGALLDIVSFVPPEMRVRGEIYLSSVGQATLVVEGVDSMSGEVVFRAVERRSIESGGDGLIRANAVTTWSEVRRVARRWATILREGLESIHE